MEKLVESLARIMSTQPINETEVTVDRLNGIYIKSYDASRKEDKNYIGIHKNEIWEFLNNGYVSAGLGNFSSCRDEYALNKNATLVRIASRKDDFKPIAMSVYTSYAGGYKCVGITRVFSDDEQLIELSKIALKHIIKMDISKFQEYVWIECDGAIKHYWEKYGGIKIPNKYLPCILPEKILSRVTLFDDEEYDYQRKIGTGPNEITVTKCIFGFNTPETLQKYIQEYNTSVDELLKSIREKMGLNESIQDEYTEVSVRQEFLRIYVINMNEDENFTLSEHEVELVKDSYDIIKRYFDKYGHILNPRDNNFMNMILENIFQLLDSYTILKPYTLDDYLECAELINTPLSKIQNIDKRNIEI